MAFSHNWKRPVCPLSPARVVNYTFDGADRPSSAVDGGTGLNYVSAASVPPSGCPTTGVCYTPQGSIYSMTMARTASFTGINITDTYNSRLQPAEMKASSTTANVMDLTYNFVDPATAKNAGHVYGITNNLDNTRSQTFTYDQLNRLIGAQTVSTKSNSLAHCWSETYTLDAWSNLNSISPSTNTQYTGCTQESGFSSTADARNHLPGFAYDAAGNTTSDASFAYTYDSESQLNYGGQYSYDGDGNRILDNLIYFYDFNGRRLTNTDGGGNNVNDFIYFGNQLICLPVVDNWYIPDMLGSTRILTSGTGVLEDDYDYLPYGGERDVTFYRNAYIQFEGAWRDPGTNNDYFGARYYSNRYGRWLSADWSSVPVAVPYANLTNPQTLNLYSMVADDPESFADLDGHCGEPNNTPCKPQTPSGCGAEGCGSDGGSTQPAPPTLPPNVNPQTQANIGIAKELVNTVTGLINLLGEASPYLVGTSAPPPIPQLEPSNGLQQVAMGTTSILLLAIPGADEAKAPEALKLAKSLASESQVAGPALGPIIGAGTPDTLKKAGDLASRYGGKPEEWSKMTSDAYRAADGSVISTHWYQQVGSMVKYELKTIIDSAPWKLGTK